MNEKWSYQIKNENVDVRKLEFIEWSTHLAIFEIKSHEIDVTIFSCVEDDAIRFGCLEIDRQFGFLAMATW